MMTFAENGKTLEELIARAKEILCRPRGLDEPMSIPISGTWAKKNPEACKMLSGGYCYNADGKWVKDLTREKAQAEREAERIKQQARRDGMELSLWLMTQHTGDLWYKPKLDEVKRCN